MSGLAIEAHDVAKLYKLGQQERYKSLRDTLTKAFGGPLRLAAALFGRRPAEDKAETFWALNGVSFQVKQGEVVGIIGRNGAGKSTLLKILSRITEPTRGRVTMRGRVASLLEVGTGFHPELTGRENIFLNGAILGMTRVEIRRRFDEIVEFAEVAKFLDTAVKHYSSGMYMRLAFSVAAHLEPEILLVDEVLAVGDASFQRKCLNKMESVGKHGRTVFFVSHNMPAITRLCPRAIMLDAGKVYDDGPAAKVVGAYLRSGLGTVASRDWPNQKIAPGNDVCRLRAVRVRGEDDTLQEAVDIRLPVRVEMDFDVLSGGRPLVPNFHFYNEDGVCLFIAHDLNPDWRNKPRPPGSYRAAVHVPGNFLSEGTIIIRAAISTHDPVIVHVNEADVVAFQVIDRAGGDTARGDYAGPMPGMVRPLLTWSDAMISDVSAGAGTRPASG
jgi:lipopolysaccharide transport system ATP-binding protein